MMRKKAMPILLERLIAATLTLLALSATLAWAQEKKEGKVAQAESGKPKKVTVTILGEPVERALQRLFEAAGESLVLDSSAATGEPITAVLKEVPFEDAVALICSVAGLKWNAEANIFIITKPGAPSKAEGLSGYGAVVFGSGTVTPGAQSRWEKITLKYIHADEAGWLLRSTKIEGLETVIAHQPTNSLIVRGTPEAIEEVKKLVALYDVLRKQLEVSCPHCKKTTVLEVGILASAAKQCPKCNRWLERDWNFCPFDGTKLPEAPKREQLIKNCPFCGKAVPPPKLIVPMTQPEKPAKPGK